MNKKFKKEIEFKNRTCEALLIGFDPKKPIFKLYGENFYIPSRDIIDFSLGYACNKICEKQNFDLSKDDCFAGLDNKTLKKIQPKIVKGLKIVTFSYDRDSYSVLEDFLVYPNSVIKSEFCYGKGHIYNFRHGQRKKAIENANIFWNEKEMEDFKKLHKFMREYSSKYYSK